jgi:hypothetical protein
MTGNRQSILQQRLKYPANPRRTEAAAYFASVGATRIFHRFQMRSITTKLT